MNVDMVLNEIRKKCEAHNASEIILFGSRAKGTSLERSDIDIAVSGVSDIESLRGEIEQIPTLYTIDLVDMDTCANMLLIEDIRKYGHKI